MAMQGFVITEEQAGGRADVFVAKAYPKYARTALVRLFDSGHITLNDDTVKPGQKLRAGDKLSVDMSPLDVEQQVVELPVLYEDDDVIVINKPVGIISHARGRYWYEPSVASFVRSHVSEDLEGDRAGIVHRLDRATSGVMICAKNKASLSFLQKQFSNRQVEKTYHAIIQAGLEPPEAIIDMPIERNPKAPSTFRVGSNGKPAVTKYKTLRQTPKYQLLELRPQTGRTHQLRVHLAKLHHPIVGDVLYDGAAADRLFLHAKALGITLPNGSRQLFEAPEPADFQKLLGPGK